MSSMQFTDAQQALEQLCAKDPIPLDMALYWIAKDEDPQTPDDLIQQLDQIAAQIHIPNTATLLDAISHINLYLFHDFGLQGNVNDYYHPHNSLLHQVLQKRQGLPILLSIVYMEVARRLGFPMVGIGFPQHFLVQPAQSEEYTFFIDPFDRGSILTTSDLLDWHQQWGIDIPFEQCLEPSRPRDILLRVCHNLFYAHNRLHSCEGMLRSIHRLMILQPEMSQLHRTRSIILGKLQRYPESLDSLHTYMLHNPNAHDIQACQHEAAVLKKLCR